MSLIYNRAKKEIMDGTIDLLTATVKVMLVANTYTADPDHDFVDMGGASDPLDAELSGTGYAGGWGGAGRKTLSTKAITEDDANNRAEFDAADLTWAGINAGTIAAMILIIEGGANDTTSKLIAYIDGGLPLTTNGGDVTIQWNAEGILQLT